MSSDHHPDVFGPMLARSRRRTAVMWAAIAFCVGLVVALLFAGFGDDAWTIGALVLMLSCVGVCAWAWVTSQRDFDEAVAEAKRFVTERNAANDARRSGGRPN